jgi:hypothetical protein
MLAIGTSSATKVAKPPQYGAGIRGYPVIRFAGNDGARFAAKNCWANAQRLWVADQLCEKRLSYWECRYLIPHAWVTIRGKVVDVTAEAYERWCRRHKIAATGFDYSRGVRIAGRKLLKHLQKNRRERLPNDEIRR